MRTRCEKEAPLPHLSTGTLNLSKSSGGRRDGPSQAPWARSIPAPRAGAHSRDKNGVDEVGGIEGGGRALPGAQHRMEVAAVENGVCLHGGLCCQGRRL